MKKIDLGNGHFAKVDDDFYEKYNHLNWRYEKHHSGNGGYAVTTVKLHRLVTGAERGEEIDHLNRDKLDNRKENLRRVSSSENRQNRRPDKRNSSGYRGVHFQRNRWVARLAKDGKRIWLGAYATKEEAAKAYDKAAKELYGEKAYLNLPLDSVKK